MRKTFKRALALALSVSLTFSTQIVASADSVAAPTAVTSFTFDGTVDGTTYTENDIAFTMEGATVVENPDDATDKVLALDADNDGTVTGTDYISSVEGALSAYDFTNGFSISMNIRPTVQFSDWNYLFAFGSNGATDAAAVYNYVDGTVGFIVRKGDPYVASFPGGAWQAGNTVNSDFAYFKNAANAGKWYNVTYVYGPSSTEMYVNGVLATQWAVDTSAVLGTISNGRLNLGCGIDPGLENFSGYVDDVKVYNAALTADEVNAAYAEYKTAVTEVTVSPETATVSNSYIYASEEAKENGNVTIADCGSVQLSATVLPENASVKTIAWSVDDETKATVEDGLVTLTDAVKDGDVITVTATSMDDATVYGTATITASVTEMVETIPVEEIEIEDYTLYIGNLVNNTQSIGSVIPEVTITPADADIKDVVYTTKHTSVVSIEGNKITALAEGRALVTATSQSSSAASTYFIVKVEQADEFGESTIDGFTAVGFAGAECGFEALTGDFDITYSFVNKSNGANSWDNFIVEVTDNTGNWGTFRGDGYGWGALNSESIKWDSAGTDWNTLADDLKDSTVVANIARKGNVLSVEYTITGNVSGNVHTMSGEGTAPATMADTLYVHLTGENVTVSDITVAQNELTVPDSVALDQTTATATTEYVFASEEAQATGEYASAVFGTVQLTATVSPADAFYPEVVWSVDDETKATVTDGLVTLTDAAVAGDEIVVTAKAAKNEAALATCTITVAIESSIEANPVTSVAVDNQTIGVGESVTPAVTILPENADIKDVVMTTENTDVISISGSTITGVAVGTATVTVTSNSSSGASTTFEVEVVALPTASKQVDYAFDGTLPEGATLTGSKVLDAATGTAATFVDGVNGKAVFIGGAGSDGVSLGKGLIPGNTFTISFWAAAQESTSFTPMVFLANSVESGNEHWSSIATQAWQASMDNGPMIWSNDGGTWYDVVPTTTGTLALNKWFNVTVTVNNGTAKIYIDGIEVASGNVPTFYGADTEVYLGVNAWDTPFYGAIDELKIYSSALTAEQVSAVSTQFTAPTYVPTTPAPSTPDDTTVAATSVKLNKKSANLTVGKKLTLKATVAPADTTDVVTYKSSNEKVATVDANGVVTAKKRGTVTITATAGTKTATCKVKVYAKTKKLTVKAAGYNVNKITLVKGKSVKLVATVSPKTAMKGVTYKSSNPKVAKVVKGKVTALKKGTAKITVASKDGLKKKVIKVTVVKKKVVNKKLVLKKNKVTLKKKGATAQITVKTLTKKATSKITYKVASGKKYVKVNKYGKVTAKVKATKKAKKAVITVKCGNVSKKYTVTIKK